MTKYKYWINHDRINEANSFDALMFCRSWGIRLYCTANDEIGATQLRLSLENGGNHATELRLCSC